MIEIRVMLCKAGDRGSEGGVFGRLVCPNASIDSLYVSKGLYSGENEAISCWVGVSSGIGNLEIEVFRLFSKRLLGLLIIIHLIC